MNGYTATTTVQQQTLGYQPSPPESQMKHLKVVRALGIVELIIGIVSMVLGVTAILIITAGNSTSGIGIWGGVWFILAGGFGVAAGSKVSSRCQVITHMVLSILGAIAAFGQAIWTSVFALGISYGTLLLEREGVTEASGLLTGLFVVYCILAVLNSIAFFVLIVSASYCCCALPGCCCETSGEPSHMMVVQGTTQHVPAVQAPPVKYPGSDYPVGPGYAPL